MTPLWLQRRQRQERAETVGRRLAETMPHDELVTWAGRLCGMLAGELRQSTVDDWLNNLEAKVKAKEQQQA